MNRIMILGSAGSGKSTLAKQLGSLLDIEVVHMDRLFWKPGWLQSTNEELQAKQEKYINNPSWIIEGNYSSVWDVRLLKADTVIFLDLNRYLCTYRILKRWLKNIGGTREDLAPGCPERMTREFIQYVWNYPKNKRNKGITAVLSQANESQVIIMSNRKAVEQYLNKFRLQHNT
ncbi:hypothetical protein [Halobacillus seohaensis]|uniref:Topology modulation protein n=1 Tax=Halobacillus seohaensis TaxID=447421 RepID=A0ABW2EGL6_9BACI